MTEEGDYKVCWDNSISHFNSKTVFFGLMVENEDDDDDDLWDDGLEASVTAEEIYEMKIEDIKASTVLFSIQCHQPNLFSGDWEGQRSIGKMAHMFRSNVHDSGTSPIRKTALIHSGRMSNMFSW